MMDTDKLEEAATLEAFTLCCNFLWTHGHESAAADLTRFLNEAAGGAPDVAATELASPQKLTRETARHAGYTGNECQTCNSMRMVRTGTCERCESCGNSTSCS